MFLSMNDDDLDHRSFESNRSWNEFVYHIFKKRLVLDFDRR